MSVILYRGENETIRIEPRALKRHLDAGWRLERSVPRETLQETADEAAEEAFMKTAEDMQQEPETRLESLRREAKERGIEGYETMRTKRLLRELGYEDES